MLRVISKTTLKLVGIRRYVELFPCHVICSSHCLIQVRRGVFQSDPILETLLSYYSSYRIMEPLPVIGLTTGSLIEPAGED